MRQPRCPSDTADDRRPRLGRRERVRGEADELRLGAARLALDLGELAGHDERQRGARRGRLVQRGSAARASSARRRRRPRSDPSARTRARRSG